MSDLHAQLLAKTRPLVGAPGRLGAMAKLARAAVRAVVELHTPVPCGWALCRTPLTHRVCAACGSGVNIDDCPTLLAIARELGIPLPTPEKENPTDE